MKRKSLKEAECPVALSLDAIGDWWSLLIVRDALDGIRRFGEFQKSLGIAKGILSARLKALTDAGVLAPAPAADGSAYQEYVLTEKGRGLFPVIVALRQWGENCLISEGGRYSKLVDVLSGQPVERLELRAADGRLLGAEDTLVRKAV